MKASLKWIREIVPGLDASAEEIEERLTAAGIEVEGTEREGAGLAGVITAEVRTCDKHPDADKLSVCTVFDGEKEHNVICGAPNARAGLKVAFAPVGTTLPGGFTLVKKKIRGVASEGMLCSEAELELSENHDGIIELDPGMQVGLPLAEVLGKDDVVFELGVTPNRPDVLSHFGLARELAAMFGRPTPRAVAAVQATGPEASASAQVRIDAASRCAKYVGRVITGVKVGPSPQDVQARLRAVGQRPISNVVDATNLALMELGHPLHAFDLHRLEGAQIIVRPAGVGEKIELLDGSTKTLTEDDLVIADAAKPVALAGVMGGANSEVHEGTVDVLLEAAVFDPSSVRRTGRRHGLHTEASHRFERGVDAAMVEAAIDRCAALILEMAGGTLHAGRVTATGEAKPKAAAKVRPARAAMLIGRPVSADEVKDTLTRLGLTFTGEDGDALVFDVPSWRVDLTLEEDLIEEVGRLHGYDDLPAVMPPAGKAVWQHAPAVDVEGVLRDRLVGQGFFEAVSLAFAAPAHLEAMGLDPARAVVVTNPLGEESQLMRPSMLPPLLKAARLNQDNLPSITDVRLFELGRTFAWSDPQAKLPEQVRRVGVMMRGRRHPAAWNAEAGALDAYDLKAVVESMLEDFGAEVRYDAAEVSWLHPRSATCVVLRGKTLGFLGEAHPSLMEAFGLEGPPVFLAELDVDQLAALPRGPRRYVPLPKLPPAQRDLSFFIARDVSGARVLSTIRKADGQFLQGAEIFDVYEGKGVPDDQRSIAVSMTFRAADRTLTDQDVEGALGKVMKALEKLGATIRKA